MKAAKMHQQTTCREVVGGGAIFVQYVRVSILRNKQDTYLQLVPPLKEGNGEVCHCQ